MLQRIGVLAVGVWAVSFSSSAHGVLTCSGSISQSYLSRQLPVFAPSAACLSGVNCLRSVGAYWGLPVPNEPHLGFEVLRQARRVLGDKAFIELANRDLSYPINHATALAETARAMGLWAFVEQTTWDSLLQYVGREETVLVLWQHDRPRWSVVQRVDRGAIILAGPGEPGSEIPAYYRMPKWAFLEYWKDAEISGGAIIRVWR